MTEELKQKLIALVEEWEFEAEDHDEWAEGLFEAAADLRALIRSETMNVEKT